MALFAHAAHGQSLSIIRTGGSEFLIEAAVPPDARYMLQASRNLHLWVAIHEEVSGQLSYRFESAGVTNHFFRLTPWTPPAPPIRVVLLGDSTVGAGIGWGYGMDGYFKPTIVQIINLAGANFSTRIFLASEYMPQMLAIKPDFVLMQFGWVDAGGCPQLPPVEPDRCMTTPQEYADNLKTLVQAIRGFNGTPILITPPDPKHFDATGKVLRNVALGDRIVVEKEVAAQLQTHLIDLNRLSADLLNELGESGSDYISRSPEDRVHFSPEGARVISGLVVNALPDSFGPYLVEIFNQPANP